MSFDDCERWLGNSTESLRLELLRARDAITGMWAEQDITSLNVQIDAMPKPTQDTLINGYRDGVQLNPDDFIARYRYTMGMPYPNADVEIEQALILKEKFPLHWRSSFAVLEAMLRAGRPEEALQPSEILMELYPEEPESLLHYGRVLTDANRPEDAIAVFKTLARRSPRSQQPLQLQAVALFKLDRNSQALNMAEAALAKAPDDRYTYDIIDNYLKNAQSPKFRVEYWQRFRKKYPKQGHADYCLSRALRDAGDNTAADLALQSAATANPGAYAGMK